MWPSEKVAIFDACYEYADMLLLEASLSLQTAETETERKVLRTYQKNITAMLKNINPDDETSLTRGRKKLVAELKKHGLVNDPVR